MSANHCRLRSRFRLRCSSDRQCATRLERLLYLASNSRRILNHYQEIESAVDDFYTFTAGGDVHTILRSPLFYSYDVEGVLFVDWLSGLIANGTAEDLVCVDEIEGCLVPPHELPEMDG